MKLKAFAVGEVVLSLLVIFSGWVVWERNREALDAIDIDPGGVTLVSEKPLEELGSGLPERDYRRIVLDTEFVGPIEALVSRPDTVPEEGLPVVVILGGLEIGIENFRQIPDPGENIYVIYKYPYTPEYWYEGSAVVELPEIRSSMLKVPSQALTLYEWVIEQPWAEEGRVSFAGYSFGAMFLPAVFHLGQSQGIPLNPAVMAYAGVDISDLLYTNMDTFSSPWRDLLAWLGETAIYGVEPERHMPHVKNEFLLINGTKDHQVSTYSWKKLHELTPEPKTIIILEEGHMHPKKPELTKKLVKISKAWFRERGLIN